MIGLDTPQPAPPASIHGSLNQGRTYGLNTKEPTLNMAPLLVSDVGDSELTGVSRATFWRRVEDGTFPKPVQVGSNVRWRVSDLQETIAKMPARR